MNKGRVNLKEKIFKQNDKYSIWTTIIVFLISLLIFIAMFLPTNVGNTLDINATAEASYGVGDIQEKIGCEVASDGTYSILMVDPQLIFSIDAVPTESIKLTVVSNNIQSVPFEIYTAYEDGEFSAERCYKGNILEGNTGAVIDVPKGQYSFLRVDIDQVDAKFESVELFDEQPVLVPYKPKFDFWRYVVAVILPIILAIVAGLLNKKHQFAQKIINNLSKNKIKIVTIAIFVVVAILGSVLTELIFSVFAKDGVFNQYRWLVFAGIAMLIVTFVFGYKNLKEKPEKVFLPIVLILGMVMLFGSPIKHICWDLDSHYPWAVQASYPGTTYITGAYNAIDYAFPQSMFSGESNYEEDIEYLAEAEKLYFSDIKSDFSLAHLPAGIFIAVARFFGAGFVVKYNLGRLAYLLIYSIVCFFAIKKLKSGKMILAIICLFPTNLFLATNYAYDWCVTAFTMLGTAYFVSELQQPDKPISIKDTIIMGLAFVIGALPKLVYIILMGMTLFLRKNWISKKERRRYYLAIALIFAVVFTYFMITSLAKVGGVGDSRGGNVNPSDQIAGILENPFGYAQVLFKFLTSYLSFGGMRGYISNFAYLSGGELWIVMAVLLVVVSITDANKDLSFKVPLYMRGLAILLFVGMSALIATALYIDFTPVNADIINGCQPRYIVPMLAPTILLVTGQRFNIIKNRTIYNGVVLAVSSCVVMLEAYSAILIQLI